ncbi:MAG: DUF2812 domain-containing protein [bacterium]|nr:DUF2812 domain-containing protein [bacterium]
MNTITEFRWFFITDYEKEAAYLSDMHRRGWKLTRISFPGFYHFEQCQPEAVVYQLDYNQEGLQHKAEYTQMFTDCGWEYMFDYVGYSYFRKPESEMQGDEEIFCDDESRLAMLQRILAGRMLPLLCIFTGVIIPQLFMQSSHRVMFAVYIVLFMLYCAIFAYCTVAYFRMRNRIRK